MGRNQTYPLRLFHHYILFKKSINAQTWTLPEWQILLQLLGLILIFVDEGRCKEILSIEPCWTPNVEIRLDLDALGNWHSFDYVAFVAIWRNFLYLFLTPCFSKSQLLVYWVNQLKQFVFWPMNDENLAGKQMPTIWLVTEMLSFCCYTYQLLWI